MARAVGLDIGTRTIKVVELTGSPKSFKVTRVITRPVPEPDPNPPEGEIPKDVETLTSETIREIFQTLKLPKDDVSACLDSGVTIFREIIVPFLEDDQIRKVVKFEAENHLHSHAIEDVIVNWVKTGESRDGSRLTIFASPKVELQRLLDICRDAGVEPSSVDLDATALYAAFDAAGVFADHPDAIVIEVGARSTALMMVIDGRPMVMRSFMLGTDLVGTSLSREMQTSLEEGRRLVKEPPPLPHADDLLVPAATLAPPVEEGEKSLQQIKADIAVDKRGDFVRKLHREAMRSLASVHEEATPEVILLSGGGSLLPGLERELSAKFNLPVERVDLSTYVDWKDQGPDPELTLASTAPAVGCGLRILGHNPLDVELLKDEYAPSNRFDVIKGALATFVTLLFVVLLGMAYVASERKRAEQKRYRFVAARAASLVQTADLRYLTKVEKKTEDRARELIKIWMLRLPQDHTQMDQYWALLNKRFKRLEGELNLGDTPKVKSALLVWLEVYRALLKRPRSDYGGWMKILKLDVKPLSATVRVEVDSDAALDKIRQQFQQSPYFRDRAKKIGRVVEPGQVRSDGGRLSRDFDFKFKEDE